MMNRKYGGKEMQKSRNKDNIQDIEVTSKGMKFWKKWKYPILSGVLLAGTLSYNMLSANAVTPSSWTNAQWEAWVAVPENKAIYDNYKAQLQSNGCIWYDQNNDGLVNDGDVYFDSSDFDTLLKMALTPYQPLP